MKKDKNKSKTSQQYSSKSFGSFGELNDDDDENMKSKCQNENARKLVAREVEKKKEELKDRLKKEKQKENAVGDFVKTMAQGEFLKKSQEKKKKMEEELENQRKNEKYLKSGFSCQEIESFEEKDIRSMISIDENLEDNEKTQLKLFLSNVLKPKTMPKPKKEKICFNLCTEREFSSLKCSLF